MSKIICDQLYKSCTKLDCINNTNCTKIESEHPYCIFKNFCKLDNQLCNLAKDNCTNIIKNQKYNILVFYSENSNSFENPIVYYKEQIIPYVYSMEDETYLLFNLTENIKIYTSIKLINQPNRSVWNSYYFSITKTKNEILKELVDYELIRLNENIKYLEQSININNNSINFYKNLLK